MTRPGFRKGRPGGTKPASAAEGGEGFLGTSLFSQAQILHLMKNEFARSRRHSVPLGCVLLQVDRIHQLVDLHGIGLRNAVRQGLAQLVRDKTRGADLLGATNDDRYLLMLPHTDLGQTRTVAERLHQLFTELVIAIDGRELAMTLSAGITACSDQTTLFFDTFVGQAETALEYALVNGGNRIVSFGEAQLQTETGPESGSGPAADGPRQRRADDQEPGRR